MFSSTSSGMTSSKLSGPGLGVLRIIGITYPNPKPSLQLANLCANYTGLFGASYKKGYSVLGGSNWGPLILATLNPKALNP